jgi:sugar phosphate permease
MLGVVESAVMPGDAYFVKQVVYESRTLQSKHGSSSLVIQQRFYGWSILSGYLINSVGWRWMFIIEGMPAVVWAFFWWRLVDDKPTQANWLTNEEKAALDDQLKLEQQGIKPVRNYGEAFKSRVVVLLCLQYFLWSIGVYGFVMWLPSIIKASNTDIVATGWLSALPYVFAIIGMFAASYYSDKTLNRKIFVWPLLLVGAIAFYCSYLIGPDNFWLSFTLLVIAGAAMYAPYGPFFAIIPEVLPHNVAPGAMALINSFGALGSFVGAYIVGYLNHETGGFDASYIFMSGSLFLSVILTLMAVQGAKPIGKLTLEEKRA